MKTVIIVIIFLIFTNVNIAFSGGSGKNGHKYDSKQEQEQNQSQQQNQQQNVNVNTGDVSATGGNAESSSNSNSNASATGGTTTVNIESQKPITGMPLINPPSSPETQLYHLTANAVEKGIDLTLLYNDLCRPRYTKELPIENREEKSKNVQIIFTPHGNYLSAEDKKKEVKEVRIEAPAENEKVKCLGVLNAENISKKKNIPLSMIYSETGQYAASKLNGFDTIYLISNNDAVAASRGVKNSGMGLSFAPGQSWLIGQATGAIGGGLSYGSGNAQGVTQLGATFIVLGAASDGMIFKLPTPEVKTLEKPIEKLATIEEKKITVEVIIQQQPPSVEKKGKLKKTDRHYTTPNWE